METEISISFLHNFSSRKLLKRVRDVVIKAFYQCEHFLEILMRYRYTFQAKQMLVYKKSAVWKFEL